MRIVRNSGYGYPMMGGNIDSVTNQSPFYDVKGDKETEMHVENSVESYVSVQSSMQARYLGGIIPGISNSMHLHTSSIPAFSLRYF
jgi:hypothetical protein